MPSAAEAGTTFALQISRDMAGLARLGGWIDTITAALGLDKAADYALRLCAEEAAANVVMHGAADGGGEAGFVALRADAADDAVRLTIEDRCGQFDPLDTPAPSFPSKLEEARVGGLGIHLMRRYARAISYERDGGINRLILTIGR